MESPSSWCASRRQRTWEINVVRSVLVLVAILIALPMSGALAQPPMFPGQQAPQGGAGAPFPSMQGTPEDQKAIADLVKAITAFKEKEINNS